jgi:serine/threonine-protein kinase
MPWWYTAEEPMIDAGSLKPGDLVNAKYRIDSVLGQGGFGVVLAATDLSLQREVAIKVLHPALAQDEAFKARFLREARATVKLRSEHSVRVYDVGELADASPYIVMERLDGRDLGVVLQDEGRLSVDHAVEYILQATEGIAEAHAAGIVHRDIKPGNLFLTQRPDKMPLIKVLDFGLAKAPTGGDARLTRNSGLFGSPAYMSPEQLMPGADVDARADIWALGVSLYELLVGVVPFATSSAAEVAVMVLRDAPPPPHERRGEISVGLSAVILRCLEKEPSRRYADVAELAAALEPYSTPQPLSVRDRVGRVLNTPESLPGLPVKSLPRLPVGKHAITATDAELDTQPRPRTQPRPKSRRRGLWAAATSLALAASTMTAVLLVRGTVRSRPQGTVAASTVSSEVMPTAATIRTLGAASEATPSASSSGLSTRVFATPSASSIDVNARKASSSAPSAAPRSRVPPRPSTPPTRSVTTAEAAPAAVRPITTAF